MSEESEKSAKAKHTTRQYVVRFEEINKNDIALAGGKGANLGEMSQADFPVPTGFVITTAAYDAFVKENDIEEAIIRLALITREEDVTEVEEISQRIRALFSGGALPEEMEEEIRVAHEQYVHDTLEGKSALAVRSSATAKDFARANFAGQQETFLNVRGAVALMEAVRQCWASLWTARAMAYRARQEIDPADVSLAVVVQQLIPADAAGVLFTANPANGRRNEAVISAAWGLGESVVRGSVTPDEVVVDKEGGRVISRETGDKETMTVHIESGVEEQPVPTILRRQQVLDDQTAEKLARYGKEIEEHYGAPQEIEWTLCEGEISIVQSRPITAPPEPTADPPNEWTVSHPESIASGKKVRVDGDSSTVTIVDGTDEAGQPEQEEAPTSGAHKGVLIVLGTVATVATIACLSKRRG